VLQLGRLADDRVEHALLRLQAGQALLRRAGLPEHPLEGHTRIDADRLRARVVTPRQRIEERAGEPIAGPGGRPHVFGSHLNGTQRCIARNLVGNELVERLLRLDLAVRVAPALGFLVGAGIGMTQPQTTGRGNEVNTAPLAYGGAGVFVGAITAAIVDAAALGYAPAPASPSSAADKVSFRLLPTTTVVGDAGRRPAPTVGVIGWF